MKISYLPMAYVLFFSFLIALSSAADRSIINYDKTHVTNWKNDEEVTAVFESWLVQHGKSYNALGEKEKRFNIFKDNYRFIDEHNAAENKSYKLGLNRFADLTNEEYRSKYLGARTKDARRKLSTGKSDRYEVRVGDSLPDSIDWREKGAIAPVKDQGSCGSCWAFSTICSVEAINQIKTGELITLSEQELVDCDRTYNEGCNGGLMDYAFEFIIKNGGIDSDADYPYTGWDGQCDQWRKNARVVSIDSYEDVPLFNEKALQKAVVNQPVAVAIEGGGTDFQFYDSGIFTGKCGTDLDHGVTVVGYGTESGKDYWIVRNSWGSAWGEEGYIRMERNIASSYGICGIAMEPSYPVKNAPNPPNPGPSPPSPALKPEVCDSYSSCPASTTCCCVFKFLGDCFEYGCCPLQSASCCDDGYSCCPHDYPVCNVYAGTCSMSNNNPLGVKAMKRILATPNGQQGRKEKRVSAQ